MNNIEPLLCQLLFKGISGLKWYNWKPYNAFMCKMGAGWLAKFSWEYIYSSNCNRNCNMLYLLQKTMCCIQYTLTVYITEWAIITSVNMSSSWVMMAICFQSNCCISFTIPVAILVSGGTGRKKVGYVWLFDNRGDEAPGDIYMKK